MVFVYFLLAFISICSILANDYGIPFLTAAGFSVIGVILLPILALPIVMILERVLGWIYYSL